MYWATNFLCIVPALWAPLRLDRPSIILFYIQYLVIFIPGCFVVWHSILPTLPRDVVLELVLVMFLGLSLLQSVYLLPMPVLRSRPVSPPLFWTIFLLCGAAIFAYLFVTLGGNFRIANLDEIYDVRAAAAELLQGTPSGLGFYLQTWAAGVVLPFAMAAALASGKRWVLLAALGGYFFLFGIGGAKSTMIGGGLLVGIYLLVRPRDATVGLRMALACATLLVIGLLIDQFGPPAIARAYLLVVNFRTFAVPQLLIAQYYDFFQHNPLTYLGHAKGLSWLLGNPYQGQDIPLLVGDWFYGGPLGANAGFWASDGLAAFGKFGILVASALGAACFWVLDLVGSRHDPRFVAVAVSFAAMSFANVSLFTTLLTGGLGLLMLLMLLSPPLGRGPSRGPTIQ
jgi:hypothetical protein